MRDLGGRRGAEVRAARDGAVGLCGDGVRAAVSEDFGAGTPGVELYI